MKTLAYLISICTLTTSLITFAQDQITQDENSNQKIIRDMRTDLDIATYQGRGCTVTVAASPDNTSYSLTIKEIGWVFSKETTVQLKPDDYNFRASDIAGFGTLQAPAHEFSTQASKDDAEYYKTINFELAKDGYNVSISKGVRAPSNHYERGKCRIKLSPEKLQSVAASFISVKYLGSSLDEK